VDSRADLPPIDPNATYRIYAAQHTLSAGGQIAEMFKIMHSKILIREVSDSGQVAPGFSLEYDAVRFSTSSFVPTIDMDGNLVWDNLGVVSWLLEANQSEWLADAEVVPMGNATGHVVEQWFNWVLLWKLVHAEYNVYSVWDGTDVLTARQLLKDSICHTFVEDGLRAMHYLGARMDQEEPLCRNYVAFIGQGNVQPVNMENATVKQNVVTFYRFLQGLCKGHYKDFGELVSHLDNLVKWSLKDRRAYVHWHSVPNAKDAYLEADLSWPFVALNFNQRMLLPWQDLHHRKRGKCGLILGGFAGGQESFHV